MAAFTFVRDQNNNKSIFLFSTHKKTSVLASKAYTICGTALHSISEHVSNASRISALISEHVGNASSHVGNAGSISATNQ